MKIIDKILSGIEQGTTTDNLARELDMNISTLLAMIDFLLYEGYLKKEETQCSCCGSSCSEEYCKSGTRIYSITLKGLQVIS